MPDLGVQVAAIRELFDAAEQIGLPLWLESGWAIDARLGKITRPHDDIDIAFPGERKAEYVALIERLGYSRHEILDYVNREEELVVEGFRRLIDLGELLAYRYTGFWEPMDTIKDKQRLDAFADTGRAPWQQPSTSPVYPPERVVA